jgi:hypothetical protein
VILYTERGEKEFIWGGDNGDQIIAQCYVSPGFGDGDHYVPTDINIFDTIGDLQKKLRYASNPVVCGDLIFYRNYDSIKNSYTPMLCRYHFITKKDELIYQFDSSYSFWDEQVDEASDPELRIRNGASPIGIIYKISTGKKYTFVISGNRLVFWKEGNYFNDLNLPDDGFIK